MQEGTGTRRFGALVLHDIEYIYRQIACEFVFHILKYIVVDRIGEQDIVLIRTAEEGDPMPMMYYLVDLHDSLARTREGRWLVMAIAIILYLLVFIFVTLIALVDATHMNAGTQALGLVSMAVISVLVALMLGTLFALVDCIVGALLALKQYVLGPGKSRQTG